MREYLSGCMRLWVSLKPSQLVFGMVGWVLFSGVILAGGLYFVFHEHMSLKNLARVKTDKDASL